MPRVCECVSRCKTLRRSWMAEFGETPERYYTVRAILLINFCLLEVNKSPWDIGDRYGRAGNRAAHFATLELAAMGDSKNLSSPVTQRRNGTVQSNEHSCRKRNSNSVNNDVYHSIIANYVRSKLLLTMVCNGDIMRITQDSSFMNNNIHYNYNAGICIYRELRI